MLDRNLEIQRQIMIENICTVFATALCVGAVALATESLHCFWGLAILVNLGSAKKDGE